MLTQTKNILLHWGLFAGTHLTLSHDPIRSTIISQITQTEDTFLGGYSVISLYQLYQVPFRICIQIPFDNCPSCGNNTKEPTEQSSYNIPALENSCRVLVSQSFWCHCSNRVRLPSRDLSQDITSQVRNILMVFPAYRFRGTAVREPVGIERVTRHSLFTGIGLWGLGHALLLGTESGIVFSGGYDELGLTFCVQHRSSLGILWAVSNLFHCRCPSPRHPVLPSIELRRLQS